MSTFNWTSSIARVEPVSPPMRPSPLRAIGSAMADAGFDKTRSVLQQWNRNFHRSQMQLDGKIPDLFMVSSMSLHSQEYMDLIRDTQCDVGGS